MRKVWGLYSSQVDPYNRWELIELFADEDQAKQARDLLAGKLIYYGSSSVWQEDKDEPAFSDLHVIEKIVR